MSMTGKQLSYNSFTPQDKSLDNSSDHHSDRHFIIYKHAQPRGYQRVRFGLRLCEGLSVFQLKIQ